MQLIQQGFYAGSGRTLRILEVVEAIGKEKVAAIISDEATVDNFQMIVEHRKPNINLTGISFFHTPDVEGCVKDMLVEMSENKDEYSGYKFILVHSQKPLNLKAYEHIERVIVINYTQANRPEYSRIVDTL